LICPFLSHFWMLEATSSIANAGHVTLERWSDLPVLDLA
jgi:hypothetical protein